MQTTSSSDSTIFLKLMTVWLSTIAGWTITQWAAVFACVYTVLQIVVLVRDKFIRDRKDKS